MSIDQAIVLQAAAAYQPQCIALFNHYQAKILLLMPFAQVEHIGASAIPDAISKGDLDIYVGVPEHLLEDAVICLLAHGFTEKTDTFRCAQLCMLEAIEDKQVAIQLVALGSVYVFFLAFRDRLRQRPELVVQYNQIKRAAQYLGMDEYRAQKAEFIRHVLR